MALSNLMAGSKTLGFRLAWALVVSAASWTVAEACQPSGGGGTCGSGGGGGGGSSTLGEGGPSIGAGNPINILNGNKYQEESDLAALPGVLGLELKRYYNSQSSHPGLVGANWRISYESVLYDFGGEIQILQADGRRLMFQRGIGEHALLCSSPQPLDGQVRIEPAKDGHGPTYLWRWANGRTLAFSSATGSTGGTGFPLQSITAATGERVTLNYSPRGELTSVRDPQGRKLLFIYAADKRGHALKAIDTPFGRLAYQQDSIGRLTEVAQSKDAQSAPFATRVYHYEERYNAGFKPGLTGISIKGIDPQTNQPIEQRLSTYAYNAAGLAILSTKGRPQELQDGKPLPDTGIEQVQLRYLSKPVPQEGKADKKTGQAILSAERLGKTLLTNSLGQQTEITSALIAGHYRLIEMKGPGCSTCGPGDMRYTYDAQGLLLKASKLDRQGQPIRDEITELDKYGRTVRVGIQSVQNGKAQPIRWTERYEYADQRFKDGSIAVASQPSLVARPSVIAGKEHTVALVYNAFGQITQATENGFSPVDAMGAPMPQGASISRSIVTTYETINGRSLPVQIDGALPNGPLQSPADSDIVRYAYDAQGAHVTAITAPGDRRIAIVRDAAGRITMVSLEEPGFAARSEIAYTPDWPLAPRQLVQRGWQVDAKGQPIGEPVVRQTELKHGAMGLLEEVTLDGGSVDPQMLASLRKSRLYLDGDLMAKTRGTDDAAPAIEAGLDEVPLAAPALDDLASQSSRFGDALQIERGARGTAAEGHVLGMRSANAAVSRQLDDFGRVVAIGNPGQALQTAVYDAADHLLLVIDPRGARQQARWNAAGQLLAVQRFMPGSETAQQTLTWQYLGTRVASESITDADGTRRTQTQRDAQGRVVSETQTISPANALTSVLSSPIVMRQRFRYDAQGRLIESVLSDAAETSVALTSTPNSQGQPERITQQGWLPERLGGGRSVVKHIDWQLLPGVQYATAVTHGNDVVDRFERLEFDSAQGRPRAPSPGAALPSLAMSSRADNPAQGPGRVVDAGGFPSVIATAQGDQQLSWNAAGQLAESSGALARNHYVYDAQGRRVLKLSTLRTDPQQRAVVSIAVYQGARLVGEADAQGRLTYAYAHLGWRPVAQIVVKVEGWWQRLIAWLFGFEVRALHTDRAGRLLSMSDARGHALWQAQTATSVHQPLRYVGQYHDDESGLDYHGARYFEARSGRFISPDPAGVSDAVNEVEAPRLLDLYAYAAGRPEDYFDPDGAARIRYFAITTGAGGKSLGTTQGFTTTRWAFIVDQIEGSNKSGDALSKLEAQYDQSGKAMLYDGGGDFLAAGATFSTWDGDASTIPKQFTDHYGANLISIAQFTVDTMSDDNATKLIASYIPADWQALSEKACLNPAKAAFLPPIKFADEEPELNPTVTDPARKQRILACGAGSDKSLEQRRVAKYEAALELNELAPHSINHNCSADGCPGVSYYCDASVCHVATHVPTDATQVNYVASYGQTQFTGEAIIEVLSSKFTELSSIMGTITQKDLAAADARGRKMTSWWNSIPAIPKFTDPPDPKAPKTPTREYIAAGLAWDKLPEATKTKFTQETGLGEKAYEDIVRFKTDPPRNSAGTNLAGDARAGLVTAAIFSDASLKSSLMGIFEDFDKGITASKAYVKGELNSVLRQYPDSSADEQLLAARVARKHNGGSINHDLAYLTAHDANSYVEKFLGVNVRNEGEWNSLRCAESFGANNTVKPGTEGKGIGGLQFTTLQLR